MNELFQQIVNQCSCPVELIRYYKVTGLYYHKSCYGSDSRIEIFSVGNNAEDIATLLHEQVHHKHEENGCKCIKLSNRMLAEYHAYKESLQAALKLKNKNIVKEIVSLIKRQLKYKGYHRTAARKVTRLKLWQKALNFIT